VVVKIGAAVVADRLAGVRGLGDEPHLRELLQHAVDRGAREAANATGHPGVDGVRRRVVRTLEHGLEDGEALARAGDALRPADVSIACELRARAAGRRRTPSRAGPHRCG